MLTLAAVCLPEGKEKHLERIVRALYMKRKRPLSNELKSVDLNKADKELFMKLTSKLLIEHRDIHIRSMTVSKQYVKKEFQNDPNRFYNYMVRLLLLKTICQCTHVDFMPDRRNERVSARWNLGEYIKQMVYDASFRHDIKNQSCNVTPMDSSKCLSLQFIDFYAGLVWSKYEYQHPGMASFMTSNRVSNFRLFFPGEEGDQEKLIEI